MTFTLQFWRKNRKSLAILSSAVLALSLVAGVGFTKITHAGNGNPMPGVPHDTIIIHIQKMTGNPNNCDGGHSLHIGAEIVQGRVVNIPPTNLKITMQDWAQVDNDRDGVFDEDPVNGIDDDLDGAIDEDPQEPGKETRAIDCDSRDGDGTLAMQIGDKDPRKGWVSTQSWFMRLVGIPHQNFVFKSTAEHTVSCVSIDPGADGITGTADDVYACDFEQVELADINLAEEYPAAIKAAGKGAKAGGKTSFYDITYAFLVDVDINGDGIFDLFDRHIFSVSCEDNPETTEINETLDVCPLGSVIWDIDNDTNRPTIQIFVSHDGSAQIVGAKKIGNANNG